MILEHFALNVSEPHKMKDWYVKHLDLSVVSEMTEPPNMIFLADQTGRVIFEFYYNPAGSVLDFKDLHHLTLHCAFETKNASMERTRLEQAGCSFVEEVKKADGSHLVMMRDPWGLALQLCERGTRMNTIDLP